MKGRLKDFLFLEMIRKFLIYFFADDSLLFCRAKLNDIKSIQEILGKYEKALGQKINLDKTTLFF